MNENDLKKHMLALDEQDAPASLRGKIMKRVWLLKFRTPMLVFGALLLANLAATLWRVHVHLAQNESYYLMRTFVENFEWDGPYLAYVLKEMTTFIPGALSFSLLANITLLAYAYHLFKQIGFGRKPNYNN